MHGDHGKGRQSLRCCRHIGSRQCADISQEWRKCVCLLVVRTGVMYKTTVVAREGRILDSNCVVLLSAMPVVRWVAVGAGLLRCAVAAASLQVHRHPCTCELLSSPLLLSKVCSHAQAASLAREEVGVRSTHRVRLLHSFTLRRIGTGYNRSFFRWISAPCETPLFGTTLCTLPGEVACFRRAALLD